MRYMRWACHSYGHGQGTDTNLDTRVSWSYGVTVRTLDSESSDRGSNPRRTFRCSQTDVEQQRHLSECVCHMQSLQRWHNIDWRDNKDGIKILLGIVRAVSLRHGLDAEIEGEVWERLTRKLRLSVGLGWWLG